jgi:hypothetical protein
MTGRSKTPHDIPGALGYVVKAHAATDLLDAVEAVCQVTLRSRELLTLTQ